MEEQLENGANVESVAANVDQDLPTEQGATQETDANKDNEESKGEGSGKEGGKETPLPSKAKTAIRNRDRKIAKLYARIRELEQADQVAQSQEQPQQQALKNEPKEEDFDTYAEFLEAKILHKVEDKNKVPVKKGQEQNMSPEVALRRAQREAEISQKSAEYSKTIPDFQEVMSENLQFVDYMPPEIEEVFYEADDAALAFYNMAKNGQLADLMEVTPYKAAMMVAQAQGIKPQTKTRPAPKHIPMSGAKGTGRAQKSIKDMTPDEIVAKYIKD